MSDWQERITRETAPAIRAEHELRYRLSAPLVASSAVWADLGCGTGLAARAAVADGKPASTILVDLDEQAVARAAQELEMPEAERLPGDLTDPAQLERIGQALRRVKGARTVTCFEVVEHLSGFDPLLEWMNALAGEGAATCVISVPDDAFWSIENPYHATSWGEGAFAELERLLPPERTLLRQVALAGSALTDWESSPVRHELEVQVGGDAAVATHFIAAFGPRHQELHCSALASQADFLGQRRWERQRESNLALAEKEVQRQREVIATQYEELRSLVRQSEEWRTYIHQLERELGKPLSGVDEGSE